MPPVPPVTSTVLPVMRDASAIAFSFMDKSGANLASNPITTLTWEEPHRGDNLRFILGRPRASGLRTTHPEAAMADRKWSDLSTRTRRLIIVAAVAEGILKVAALVDIARRPADQIRGSKWVWAPTVLIVNSFGGAPLAYFAFGRRRDSSS
jgi:hypothetical protein